jgi:IS4 transposase
MAELVDEGKNLRSEVVSRRDLQSRSSFDRFTKEEKFFITRVKSTIRCKVTETKGVPPKPEGSAWQVASDRTGYLINKTEKKSKHPYRLITATVEGREEPLCFITNLMEEDAYTVAKWYKERWEIELFFKFLKQHLNFSHLVRAAMKTA